MTPALVLLTAASFSSLRDRHQQFSAPCSVHLPASPNSATVAALIAQADQIDNIAARLRLDGRRIIVLSGSRGMGRHTAHSLGQLGALPRLTEPKDVAAGLTFLVSDLAAAVTGQTLVMDAGATSAIPIR